jgi:hypothetical protein
VASSVESTVPTYQLAAVDNLARAKL